VNKNKIIPKICIIILFSISITILIYHNLFILGNKKQTDIFLQTSQLSSREFELSIWHPISINGIDNDLLLKWWQHENQYFLFLPSSWQQANTHIIFNQTDSLFLDGTQINNGDSCSLSEGTHFLTLPSGNTYTFEVLYSSDIASLFINTKYNNLDYINESKENVDSGEYILFNSSDECSAYGEIEELYCRGNSSFTKTMKKSYNLKLKTAEDIFGFGESKKWLLIANYYDKTLMRNMLVNEMANALEMEYTPQMDFVDLYVNGDYVGNYLLSEKIEIAPDRLDITNLEQEIEQLNPDEDYKSTTTLSENENRLLNLKYSTIDVEPTDYTGGYLLEVELPERYPEESSGFTSALNQTVVIKSPQYVSYAQSSYIANIYQDLEDSLFQSASTSEYKEYIDESSFIKHYLIDEISKQLDAGITSFYIYKTSNNNKLFAGPIWDYDKCFGCAYERYDANLASPTGLYAALPKSDSDLWYGLYQKENFQNNVKDLYWSQMRPIMLELGENWLPETQSKIHKSAIMNCIRWPRNKTKVINTSDKASFFNASCKALSDFMYDRLYFLDNEWKESNLTDRENK